MFIPSTCICTITREKHFTDVHIVAILHQRSDAWCSYTRVHACAQTMFKQVVMACLKVCLSICLQYMLNKMQENCIHDRKTSHQAPEHS